jgi:hypothetical protein
LSAINGPAPFISDPYIRVNKDFVHLFLGALAFGVLAGSHAKLLDYFDEGSSRLRPGSVHVMKRWSAVGSNKMHRSNRLIVTRSKSSHDEMLLLPT